MLGLPSGYLLALTDMIVPRMGPAGFWCGFIIGLTSAAIMMMLRMRFLQRQPSSIIFTAPLRANPVKARRSRRAFRSSLCNGALYIPLLPDTKDSLIASRQAL